MGQTTKFGLIADPQGADNAIYTAPGGMREPDSYARRVAEAGATWRDSGIQFAFFLGDINDSNGTDAFLKDTGSGDSFLTDVDNIITDGATGINGGAEPYYMWGNHDVISYDGVDTSPTIASWFADLASQGARSNELPNDTTPYSYTFDKGGIRFIVFHYWFGFPVRIPAATLSWLGDRLDETTMPVVIFTHCQTWINPDKEIPTGFTPNETDTQLFYDEVDARPNVQAVFSGHWHLNGTDMLRNDIYYISNPGSVLYFADGDNAYFTVEIDPNAVMGDARPRANIKITGFGTNGVGKTKDFDTFAIM